LEQQTKICKNGAKNPKWTDSLTFSTCDPNLKVEVWDCDTVGKDCLIGSGTTKI
jgi:hypothetical protein